MLLGGREPDADTVALAQLVVESAGDAAGRERAGCRHCCAGTTRALVTLLGGKEPDAGTVALAQLVVESAGDAAGRERAGCRHCCAGATGSR